MIDCLVVDDEQLAIDVLHHHISKVPFLNLVATAKNALDAVRIMSSRNIDLIFLDICMPELSGIELAGALRGKCQVILTTAYSEYAINGFELNVTDYLLKPISLDRFITAAQRALDLFENNLFKSSIVSRDEEYIYVKTETKGKLTKIVLSEIDYIEALKNYVAIHRRNEKIMVLISMRSLEDKLPIKKFIRVHKSFIVNADKIDSLIGGRIVMQAEGHSIPIGESYKEPFLQFIKDKLV